MPTPYTLNYLLTSLDASPDVQAALLKGVPKGSRLWDAAPGPDRFTLRESLAHLADWEPIWLFRMRTTVEQDRPFLPGIDEGELAVQNNYAASDPAEALRKYRAGRTELVAFLRGLDSSVWPRKLERGGVGEMTFEELVLIALVHDGYHLHHTLETMQQGAAV